MLISDDPIELLSSRLETIETDETVRVDCPCCTDTRQRLYYIKGADYFYCHNEQQRKSLREIQQALLDKPKIERKSVNLSRTVSGVPDLVHDCVTLHYGMEGDDKIQMAWEYCSKRGLLAAVNRPENIWFCPNEYRINGSIKNTFVGRILFTFGRRQDQDVSMMGRSVPGIEQLYPVDGTMTSETKERNRKLRFLLTEKKYMLSKGDKPLFGLEKVDRGFPYLFITEGLIESLFIKNGVSCMGIPGKKLFSDKQRTSLEEAGLQNFTRIWILDNQYRDPTARKRLRRFKGQGELVFIWPQPGKTPYKDFAEVCEALKWKGMSTNFILNNSTSNPDKIEAAFQKSV